MYPTEDEKIIIEAAEKLMVDTMARYDPSHDAYHGQQSRVLALSHLSSYLFPSAKGQKDCVGDSPCIACPA